MQNGILSERKGHLGLITLNRPQALNALSLSMVRGLFQVLANWRDNPQVRVVAIRGSNKAGPFGGFCAGGDIRFFHAAALAGNPELEDFFTEEYTLNHLIHHYPKPYVAFMDGVVMGGGMGISQGASRRLVTERTKMAMPETHIGLFPDVGGGYFLSRCPGSVGEWLALTGHTLDGAGAVACGLADMCISSSALSAAWDALAAMDLHGSRDVSEVVDQCLRRFAAPAQPGQLSPPFAEIDAHFSLDGVPEIVAALQANPGEWAQATLTALQQHSPLMQHVALAQIRRARHMSLADALRMERTMVRHCFSPQHLGRSRSASETVEGIRALAIDKDHNPRWNPARLEDVTPEMVNPFFESPWPAWAHPLNHLVDDPWRTLSEGLKTFEPNFELSRQQPE